MRILALAVALTVAEWLRGHILTRISLERLRLCADRAAGARASASVIGLWGLTFLAVAIFAVARASSPTTHPTPAGVSLPLCLGVAALAALAVYGACGCRATRRRFVDSVQLRIMQPNLPQDEKFNYRRQEAMMAHYLSLSDRATGPQTQACATSRI